MISVVCVYNRRDVFEGRLLASLERQEGTVDLVEVDNRDRRFPSAAEALNHGAARARGDWWMFVHQDVVLLSPGWLQRVEAEVERMGPFGWAGAAGVDDAGGFRGLIRDRGMLRGEPFPQPREVQTLDECLLLTVPGSEPPFDPELSGWHVYGVDACLRARRDGLRNYVLPEPVWHDSPSTNLEGLREGHAHVWRKHGAAFGRIHTTCGTLPGALQDPGRELGRRAVRLVRAALARLRGYSGGARVWLGEALEALTLEEPRVDVLHGEGPQDPIEVAGFVPHPERPRSVLHRFEGCETACRSGAFVVLAPDFFRSDRPREEELDTFLKEGVSAVVEAALLRERPRLRQLLERNAGRRSLALHQSGRHMAVFSDLGSFPSGKGP